MTDQPNETETPHGETITHLGGYQLPYWDEDTGWPGTPFPGRWVTASKTVVDAVTTAAAFTTSPTTPIRSWAGNTSTETGETWQVMGTDRPVSATLYRDKDDQVGIHAVFIPAKPDPARGPLTSGTGPLSGLQWTVETDWGAAWHVIAVDEAGTDAVCLHVTVTEAGGGSDEATARALADLLNGGAR